MCYFIKSILVFIFFLIFTNCLKITPERSAVTYTNDTYVTNAFISVRRSKRGGPYVVNIGWELKVDVGYNVSMDVIFYEYLHNEFRRSFVEMHYKLCDVIHKDPYLGQIIRSGGLTKCPLPLGKTSLKNVNLNNDIPSVWPFEKGKAELTVTDDIAGAVIAIVEIVMTFKQ